jgi:sulfur carrier protein
MAIKIIYRNKEYLFEQKKLVVNDLYKKFDLSTETHLIVNNGELITENDVLADGDEAQIIPVISGG